MRRCLGMGEGSVSVFISLSPKRPKTLIPVVWVVCWIGPGINLAQSSVWLACAMALAVFDIGKYVDGFGNVVEPKIYYSDGTIR